MTEFITIIIDKKVWYFKVRKLPNFEIEKIDLLERIPDNWTYPEIQPKLLKKIDNMIG